MLEMESHVSQHLTLLCEGPEVVRGIHPEGDVHGDICAVFRSDLTTIDTTLTANTPG